jgi:glycosyltransferase involved in cell wall biosynthesis
MSKPLVAVFMVTYNHEKYIGQAIESVITQETTFPFKLFIGDDCSSDQTAIIALKYQEENKEFIEIIFNKQNIGALRNAKKILMACSDSGAKYIAMLEGDDYWTDPLKLQKQVDFLDANPDYSCCFHDTFLKKDEELTAWRIYDKQEFSILDTFSPIALFHTSSILFKREAFYIPKWYLKIVSGDMAIMSIVASNGKLKRIPEFMSVYRKNSGGLTETSKVIDNYHKNRIELMTFINKEFKYKYRKEINEVIYYHKCQLKKKRTLFKRIKQIILQRIKL